MPGYNSTPFDSPIHQVVTPLLTVQGGRNHFASGTAFLIGQGWAVTAYHVLEDFVCRYQDPPASPGNIDISFDMLGYLTLERGKRLLPIKFVRAWRAAPMDIAVLAFGVPADWPDDHVWTVPAIDLLPPPIGTPIVAIGYPNSRIEVSPDQPAPSAILDPTTSTGEVIEIHHQFRDRTRLSFPCFRTNARFSGGMSGGPILNNRTGKICGVVCSGTELGDDSAENISYGSALWPALATALDFGPDGKPGAPAYPLADLYRNGTLSGANADRVSVRPVAGGLFSVTAAYNPADWDHPPSG